MSSLRSLLDVARDGILAQSAGAAATGENITNANTAGYVRRQVLLETRATITGGVSAQDPSRVFDRFAFARLSSQSSAESNAKSRSEALSQLQTIVAPETGGVATATTRLFSSFADLTAYPTDTTARANVLSQADNFVRAAQDASNQLSTYRGDLLREAQLEATSANSQLTELGKLNQQVAQAIGRGESPNALEDRRDQLAQALVTKLGGHTLTEKDGSMTLLVGGVALVTGPNVSTLSVDADANNDMRIRASSSSGSVRDITAGMTGGKMGALRDVRDAAVTDQIAKLDSFTYDVANALNAAHSTGFGKDGVSGRALFTVGAAATGTAAGIKVDASVAGFPDRIAASSTAAGVPGNSENARAIVSLANVALAGGKSPVDTLASWMGELGNTVRAAASDAEFRTSAREQAEAVFQSGAGVSIDEEMVNLTKYQRAFEASARVMKIADQLLESFLQQV